MLFSAVPLTFDLLIHCSLLLLATNHVVDTSKAAKSDIPSHVHLVFVGDSVLRYQYLSYIYKIHFETESVPDFLVQEKRFGGWNEFFEVSTWLFQGHMVCDCFRRDGYPQLAKIRENRYYKHPEREFYASFFTKFGDFAAIGKDISNLTEAFSRPLPEETDGRDWTLDWQSLFEEYIGIMQPPVTAVIMNAGLHPDYRTNLHLKEILSSAMQSVPRVLWLQSTPVRGNPDKVYRLDDAIRKEICRHSSNRVTANCEFIDFPAKRINLRHESYWDNAHFKHPRTYLQRHDTVLEALGLEYLTNTSQSLPPTSKTIAKYPSLIPPSPSTRIEKHTKSRDPPLHVVFAGGDKLREQYLGYVFRLHYRTDVAPWYVFQPELTATWSEYVSGTSWLYGGRMQCDCSLDSSSTHSSGFKENRYYVLPSHSNDSNTLSKREIIVGPSFGIQNEVHITYHHLLGDGVVHGRMSRALVGVLPPAQHADREWRHIKWENYLLHHVKSMQPPPIAVILDASIVNDEKGHFIGAKGMTIEKAVSNILQAAQQVCKAIVWIEGDPSVGDTAAVDQIAKTKLCDSNESISRKQCFIIKFPQPRLVDGRKMDSVKMRNTTRQDYQSHQLYSILFREATMANLK